MDNGGCESMSRLGAVHFFRLRDVLNRTFTMAPCVPGLESVKLSSLLLVHFAFLYLIHRTVALLTSLVGLAVRRTSAVDRCLV